MTVFTDHPGAEPYYVKSDARGWRDAGSPRFPFHRRPKRDFDTEKWARFAIGCIGTLYALDIFERVYGHLTWRAMAGVLAVRAMWAIGGM